MLLKEKNEIIVWLNKYNIKNYTVVHDETYGYRVDVAGHVYLGNQNLTEIPVKFGKVSGYFDCSHNKLTSLEGSPENVGADFGGLYNQLNCLEAMPESVGGGFYCRGNPNLGELQNITSLHGIQAYLLAQQLTNALNIKDNHKKIKL